MNGKIQLEFPQGPKAKGYGQPLVAESQQKTSVLQPQGIEFFQHSCELGRRLQVQKGIQPDWLLDAASET